MHRKPVKLPWWGKAERQRPASRAELELQIRSRRREFQLEALEERNLLTGMSLGEAIQRLLAITPPSTTTSATSPPTPTTSSSTTSPADIADPRTMPISIDSGEATFAVNASTYLPTVSYIQGPSGIVAPGATFDPSSAGIAFTNTVLPNAPMITEWTRTAGTDESLSLSGSSFSTLAAFPTKFYVFTDGGNGTGKITMINTQSLSSNGAIVTLPISDVPANAMYMVWAVDNDGISRPVFVNQTETWWVGPDAAQAGQSIAIYGRNLSQTGAEWTKGVSSGTAPTWVWIQSDAGGPLQQMTVLNTNPYRVEFQLPSTLAAGSYTAWVHNGKGGDYGWGTPLKFTVRSAAENGTQWSGPTYMASNNASLAAMLTNSASADDGALLQAVLTLAGKSTTGNATVVLPSGTFMIANPLNIPSNVRLIGQGMDQSILKAIPSANFSTMGLIYSSTGNLASNNILLQDLTLHNGYNPLGATDTAYTGGIKDLLRMFGPTDVNFTRVRFDTKSNEAFEIYKGTRITVDSCDFRTTYGAFFNQSNQVVVKNSTFRLTNLSPQAIYSVGTTSISIIGNNSASESISDHSRTAQWGLRLYVNQQGGRYQYLAKNITSNLGLPTTVANNVGEQILWEGGGPQYIGSPTTVSSTTLSFGSTTSGIDFGNGRYYAVVVQGTGVGQTRRIVGQAANGSGMTLTLESAFGVAVDQTSVIQLLTLADKAVVYSNNLNGIAENVTRDTYIGPAGIMLFGGASNMVIDNNTLSNIRLGITIWSLTSPRNSGPNQYETSAYNLVTNNTITGSRYGMMIETAGGADAATSTNGRDRSTLANNIFRDNTVQSTLETAFSVAFIGNTMTTVPDQTIEGLVVEHNSFIGTPVGIDFTNSTRNDYRGINTASPILENSLIYKNTIQHRSTTGAAPMVGSKGFIFGDAQAPTLIGNSVTGFETTNADAAPITVTPTGVANTYNFTITARDIDRKGGSFNFWIDWTNDGLWDAITTPNVQMESGGRVITFTHTFASPGAVQTKFMIVPAGDVYYYVYQLDLNIGAAIAKPAPTLLNTAFVAAPTANSLEYTFSIVTTGLVPKTSQYIIVFDWNNDGVYDDGRYGSDNDMFIRKFAAGGPSTFTYMVLDTAGNSVTRKVTFDPTSRNVYYFGSEREDTVSFVETSPGTVQVNLFQIGGRDLPSVRTLTYSNITGSVIAYGYAGPDYIDASGLTNRPTTIYGGADSDTLLGGAGNDSLFGASLTGTMKTVDAQNAITGGAGSDYIWTGTNVDMVVASVTSTIQSMNNLNYLVGGLAVGASTRVATASSGVATNSALMATVDNTTSSPSLLNLGSTTVTASAMVAPSTSTLSQTSSTSGSPTKSSSTSAKTGTPAMTSSSRPSTGVGSNSVSGEVQLPAEEVDAVAIHWDIEADEFQEFVDLMMND
ncbi:hypothetical protein K2Y11_12900 [bacterium]|nr:hypothetical protein [bacterium]